MRHFDTDQLRSALLNSAPPTDSGKRHRKPIGNLTVYGVSGVQAEKIIKEAFAKADKK